MDDVKEKISAEKENVLCVLGHLQETLERDKKSVIELAAIGVFLQNMYSGIENILKLVLKSKNLQIKHSPSWHKELLNDSVANGIISESLSDHLFRYLAFRHYFIHSYGFMIEESQIEELAADAGLVWLRFIAEIDEYVKRP